MYDDDEDGDFSIRQPSQVSNLKSKQLDSDDDFDL